MEIHLHKELDKLKRQIFHLSALVEENFKSSLRAVHAGDPEAGQLVVAKDLEIDQLEVEVEEECLKILALHQPVATDLRFLIVTLKMNNDLERIGDLAVNIASGNALRAGEAMPEDLGHRLLELGEKARAMLRSALEALMDMDTDAARAVLTTDDEVDEMYREFSGVVKGKLGEADGRQGALVSWLMAAKSIERVADHATNIAEDVILATEARNVKHAEKLA